MAKILSLGKDNSLKSFWRKFNSLDLFTRLLIITCLLTVIATPFIVFNYQLFDVHGESEAERLRAIAQLQESQRNLQNIFSEPRTTPTQIPLNAAPSFGFNLIDAVHRILTWIERILSPSNSPANI